MGIGDTLHCHKDHYMARGGGGGILVHKLNVFGPTSSMRGQVAKARFGGLCPPSPLFLLLSKVLVTLSLLQIQCTHSLCDHAFCSRRCTSVHITRASTGQTLLSNGCIACWQAVGKAPVIIQVCHH